MVTHGRIVVLLGVAVLGCYDMTKLDPGSDASYLPVDDFEDGDQNPNIRDFGRWTIYPFKWGDGASGDISIVSPGGGGEHAMRGDFVFTVPGNVAVTGASLGTKASRFPIDVRRFRALYVMARVDSESILPDNTRFYADLNCDSAPPLGEVTKPFWVTDNMPVTTDWQEFRLDGFEELNTEPAKIAGGADACLAVVDGIRFTVAMSVVEPVTVRLLIDDVYFE